MSKSYIFMVQPSGGETRPLTVDDAMHQVLDLVDWLCASAKASETDGSYRWVLKKATTNTPLTIEIEPETTVPDFIPEKQADEDFERAVIGLREIIDDGGIPRWLDKTGLDVGKRLLRRNMSGVGLTKVYRAGEEVAAVHITPATSERALESIRLYEAPVCGELPQHQSYGECVGCFQSTGDYHRRPAFWIKVKNGEVITCRLTPETAHSIGGERTLDEVWEGRLVRVIGVKHYDGVGDVRFVEVESVEDLEITRAALESVVDPDFTGGQSARDYIEKLREGNG